MKTIPGSLCLAVRTDLKLRGRRSPGVVFTTRRADGKWRTCYYLQYSRLANLRRQCLPPRDTLDDARWDLLRYAEERGWRCWLWTFGESGAEMTAASMRTLLTTLTQLEGLP